ncbi:hypothetical protein [uncultured Catenibacterium sp.]|uniref:hypothetical protein n=1 Tax=uncultured Catenibacterium sp. TaxID=286142 RepID=UPI0025E06433|nr:hypothetical protein [uncultured Catenibacterium sp.]
MKRVLTILLCCLMAFGLSGCGQSKVEDAKKDLKESHEKYGSVEKETVDVLVAKFNTEVGNSSLNAASTDYLTEENNQYWYGFLEGVSLVVVPKKYTGDKATDIVDYMLIFVNKPSKYNDEALTYAKKLIKANYNKATDNEIDTLFKEAKDKSSSNKTAYNGKGISVGYLDKDDYYQYQVLRFYKS